MLFWKKFKSSRGWWLFGIGILACIEGEVVFEEAVSLWTQCTMSVRVWPESHIARAPGNWRFTVCSSSLVLDCVALTANQGKAGCRVLTAELVQVVARRDEMMGMLFSAGSVWSNSRKNVNGVSHNTFKLILEGLVLGVPVVWGRNEAQKFVPRIWLVCVKLSVLLGYVPFPWLSR